MKKTSHPLIKSALILTLAGLISRIIGFFYKIFLVSLIGAEGIGIYQMIFPIYILCISLASSGIQTAISRFTAEKLSTSGPARARSLFRTGLLMAMSLAGLISALLYILAPPIAFHVLGEARCLPLLRLMAAAIPFEVLHGCINAYFLGQKRAGFPALSQLLEQIVRVSSTFLLCHILMQKHLSPSPLLAVGGLLCAELTVSLICATVLAFQKPGNPTSGKIFSVPNTQSSYSVSSPHRSAASDIVPHKTSDGFRKNVSEISGVALPITGNRLMLNLLQSVEAAMIPLRLERFYGHSSTALSTYGVFTGMALPLIMFPCAITASLSMVLLPSVSEAHAVNDDKKIAGTIRAALTFCLFMGIIFTGAFLCFGSDLGILLYHDSRVGSYLVTLAWICPFLYLTTIMSSILHGLGKTMHVFFHNLVSLLIRLVFIYFGIPLFGINGCLWGMLASQLTASALGILSLRRTITFSFSSFTAILLPAGCCAAATGVLFLLRSLLPVLNRTDQWIPFLLSAGIWGSVVLLLSGRKITFFS